MEAQSYTAEERRAANQVWAAAGAYGFEPLFLARNTDGTIDFYMNCVVGLVHKYYGDELVRSLFDAWEGDIRQAMLDDLTWLYLESAVYALELPRRPVLSALRRAHADYFFGIQYKLSRQEWMAKNQLVYSMQAARWRAVQGRTPPAMTPYEKNLDAALSHKLKDLYLEKKPELNITNTETGEQLIKNLDMIKYLNMLKQEHYKDMELQEYLDREDRYSMIFFVDENMALIKSVIQINGWVIQLNDFEL